MQIINKCQMILHFNTFDLLTIVEFIDLSQGDFLMSCFLLPIFLQDIPDYHHHHHHLFTRKLHSPEKVLVWQ